MRSKFLGLALLAAVAVTITACGSSDDGGKTVAPSGAPYSYKVPAGFQIEDAKDIKGIPDTYKDTTAVLLSDHDLITVNSIDPVLPQVTAANRAKTMVQLDTFLKKVAGTIADKIDGPIAVKVGGQPGAEYQLQGLKGVTKGLNVDANRYVVLVGKRSVNVSCQWERGADNEAKLKAGCKQLLASLKLRS